MKIDTHPKFDKHFKSRIKTKFKLLKQFKSRLRLFKENQQQPLLKDHVLKGSKKALRAFSITGDIRVLYKSTTKTKITLLDIGTHNQVY